MTDYYAVDDEHALYLARQSIKNLNKIKDPQVTITTPREPLYDPEELYGIVGENLKKVRCPLVFLYDFCCLLCILKRGCVCPSVPCL